MANWSIPGKKISLESWLWANLTFSPVHSNCKFFHVHKGGLVEETLAFSPYSKFKFSFPVTLSFSVLSPRELAEPVFSSEELSCLPYKNLNKSLTLSFLSEKFNFAYGENLYPNISSTEPFKSERRGQFSENEQKSISIEKTFPRKKARNLTKLSWLQAKSLYSSRRKVSPVEQYTIDCEFLAYF